MEYNEFEVLVYKVFETDNGRLLLDQLHEKFVNTPIVQDDGIIPSSVRQGKSDLTRMITNIYNRIKNDV